jgi:hypothetical protein
MLMNSADRTAVLRYEPSGFRMVSPGSHVVCAVTGEKIPLDSCAIGAWSGRRPTPPEIATKRMLGL